MTTYEGGQRGDGTRIAVVCSRFNESITERLLAGALDGLRGAGVDDGSITVTWVPGAFELPLAALRLAGSGEFDAVVCLGAVVRGATGHYEQVAGQCAAGIQRAQMDTGVPVIFGVLTTDTVDQALERAGAGAGEAAGYARTEHTEAEVARTPAGASGSPPLSNKGFEAAMAALEMCDLLRQLPKSPRA
ncbi:MAG TPA: 6,7-dimethyl-8-ribityllumazine synthase [Acidimicrobiales bacterium]|nr:6,7-dimethyl-8-ribityllumazine synthase [Acidimicrobiales bacterium]